MIILLDMDGVIGSNDLPELLVGNAMASFDAKGSNGAARESASLKDAMREAEKVYILQVMKEAGGKKKKATRK